MGKHLCDLSKSVKKNFNRIALLVNKPNYLCTECGRAANEKKVLCEAKKLVKPNRSGPATTVLFTAIIAIIALLAAGCSEPTASADLVLVGGKVATVDENIPYAQAVAIVDDRIAAVGTEADLRHWIGEETEVLHLDQALVVPGLIEGHGHFLGLGRLKIELDLSSASTWEEVVTLAADRAAGLPEGSWITGRGWHQEKWDRTPEPAVQGYPVHSALSAAVPDHPVYLRHASGHGAIANAAALVAAGIDRHTPDPAGGEIVRGPDGEPTGVFLENGGAQVSRALAASRAERSPEEIQSEFLQTVELATNECLKSGITSFQDAGSTLDDVRRFRALADESRLAVRLWLMLGENDATIAAVLDEVRTVGHGNHHLTVRAIKRYIDGALGSRGAWLLEPYTDQPDTTGELVTPLDSLRRSAEMALSHGYQICTHAIGDRGNRETLDLYQEVLETVADGRERRWRIEHAQHLHADDIPRFADLGIIAAMQGVHCTSDGPWVPERIGAERLDGSYAWRSLIDSGAVVSNGTDTPVERIDPMAGFHALVTRRMNNGKIFQPSQVMTREEALQAYTLNAAYAAFEEEQKGSITPGKLADITVLSRDILTVSEDEIPGTEVLFTIVGGKILYRK
jgi:predicted amidohydrolase YtcJ